MKINYRRLFAIFFLLIALFLTPFKWVIRKFSYWRLRPARSVLLDEHGHGRLTSNQLHRLDASMLRRAGLACSVAVITMVLAFTQPARAAWTFESPVEYWLTNASPTLTNGPTGTTYSNQFVAFNLNLGVLTNSGSSSGPTEITNASQPFPIVRDRGFLLHVGLYTTNAAVNTNALAYTVMQFATPIKLITNGVSYMVTNWEYQGAGLLTNTWTATNTWAGTTAGEIYGSVMVPATTIQNATLGRLLYFINPGTNWIWWDPTNTFVSVTP